MPRNQLRCLLAVGPVAQSSNDFGWTLESLIRVVRHHAADSVYQVWRDVAGELGKRLGCGLAICALVRRDTGQQSIKNAAQAIDVRTNICLDTLQAFGGHIVVDVQEPSVFGDLERSDS